MLARSGRSAAAGTGDSDQAAPMGDGRFRPSVQGSVQPGRRSRVLDGGVAWERVRANRGARSAGVDGQTAFYVETERGATAFLTDVRNALRSREFRPLPVKERLIPKPGTRKRRDRHGGDHFRPPHHAAGGRIVGACRIIGVVGSGHGSSSGQSMCRAIWHEGTDLRLALLYGIVGRWCCDDRARAALSLPWP